MSSGLFLFYFLFLVGKFRKPHLVNFGMTDDDVCVCLSVCVRVGRGKVVFLVWGFLLRFLTLFANGPRVLSEFIVFSSS